MNDKLSNALAELAEKLGTSVEALWPTLVAKERTEAILGVLAPLITILGCFIVHKISKNRLKASVFDEDFVNIMKFFCYFLAIFISFIGCFGSISTMIYPEAAALETLTSIVR